MGLEVGCRLVEHFNSPVSPINTTYYVLDGFQALIPKYGNNIWHIFVQP